MGWKKGSQSPKDSNLCRCDTRLSAVCPPQMMKTNTRSSFAKKQTNYNFYCIKKKEWKTYSKFLNKFINYINYFFLRLIKSLPHPQAPKHSLLKGFWLPPPPNWLPPTLRLGLKLTRQLGQLVPLFLPHRGFQIPQPASLPLSMLKLQGTCDHDIVS